MKTKSIRHFTLVELLTVIVVMTILGSITIPLYNRLMTGSAVSYANRLINSQLNMARVHACRKRQAVALLVADHSLTYKGDTVPEDMAQRAFRCAYVTGSGSNWTFKEWVEGSKWEFLPRGAFLTMPDFLEITEGDGENTPYKVSWKTNPSISIDYKPTEDVDFFKKDTTVTFKFAVIYQTNGRPTLPDGTTSPKVRVQEGVVANIDSGKAQLVRCNPDNWMISRINQYTGSVITEAPEDESETKTE